jgi:hypothetical protein
MSRTTPMPEPKVLLDGLGHRPFRVNRAPLSTLTLSLRMRGCCGAGRSR